MAPLYREILHHINRILYLSTYHLATWDFWILVKTRQYSKFILKCFRSISQIISFAALSAIILLIYTLTSVRVDIPAYNIPKCIYSTPLAPKNELPQLNSNSTATTTMDTSKLQSQLADLENQAFDLEAFLQKLQSQCGNVYELQGTMNMNTQQRADFASEAAGGAVLDTPDTISYYEPEHLQATIFGFPIWQADYFTPRKVIQPWTQAGECWAFRGFWAKIKIKLAYETLIDQVTLEHIPVSASLTGSIDSAPRDFTLHGSVEDDFVPLDSFTYDINGSPSQTFDLKDEISKQYPIRLILLEVTSNWGNPKYTCVYRFKVHGKIATGDTEGNRM